MELLCKHLSSEHYLDFVVVSQAAPFILGRAASGFFFAVSTVDCVDALVFAEASFNDVLLDVDVQEIDDGVNGQGDLNGDQEEDGPDDFCNICSAHAHHVAFHILVLDFVAFRLCPIQLAAGQLNIVLKNLNITLLDNMET